MERHIVEILVILLKSYPEGAIRREDFDPLTQDLINRGYTQSEIETAMFLYHSRQDGSRTVRTSGVINQNAFRVLHDVEKAILTTDAYGYLISLNQLGLISVEEMDSIIERAVMLGGRRVDMEEIKMFVATHIMDQENGLPGPGQSYYLKLSTDRIQ